MTVNNELSGGSWYDVTIDPTGLTAGSEHTLTLEAYNEDSLDKISLKSDEITIKVLELTRNQPLTDLIEVI